MQKTIRHSGLLILIALAASAAFAADPPATQPAGAPAITWPDGRVERKPSTTAIQQIALNTSLGASAYLKFKVKSDFRDDCTLQEWASADIALVKKTPQFKDAAFDEPKSVRIGNRDAITVDFVAVVHEFRIHFRFVYFESPACFCKFSISSPPSNWTATEAQIEVLLKAIS